MMQEISFRKQTSLLQATKYFAVYVNGDALSHVLIERYLSNVKARFPLPELTARVNSPS